MSDLESKGSSVQSATPITLAAIGKLRAFGGQTPGFAQSDGLVDAFAEVFARMAVAKPGRGQEPSPTTDDGPINDQSAVRRSDSDLDRRSSNSYTDAETETDSQPHVTEVEADKQSFDVDEQQVDVSGDVEFVEHDDQQKVDVAPVEVIQSYDQAQKLEAREEAIQEVRQDDSGDYRRDRRDSAAAEPVGNAEQGGSKGDQRNSNAERIQSRAEEFGTEEKLNLESTTQGDDAESPRRVRGAERRGEELEGTANQASSAGKARSAQGQHAATNVGGNGEALASQTALADTSPARTAAQSTESAITSLQNAAQNVARPNAASGKQTNVQAGTRGSTQAIESRSPSRDFSRAGTDAPPAKRNTAETISRVKLIQRVSKAFQHLGPDGGTVRLRLAPAEMGSIRVEMRIQQRKVQARVVAESEAAGAALREHLPELRQRLEAQGMQVERLEVESGEIESDLERHTGRHGRGGDSQNPDGQWSQPASSSAGAQTTASVPQQVSQPDSARAAPESLPSNAGVDVRL